MTDERIAELINKGTSQRVMAAFHGVGKKKILEVMKKFNIEPRKSGWKQLSNAAKPK